MSLISLFGIKQESPACILGIFQHLLCIHIEIRIRCLNIITSKNIYLPSQICTIVKFFRNNYPIIYIYEIVSSTIADKL